MCHLIVIASLALALGALAGIIESVCVPFVVTVAFFVAECEGNLWFCDSGSGVNIVASREVCVGSACAAHLDLLQHGTGLFRFTWSIWEYLHVMQALCGRERVSNVQVTTSQKVFAVCLLWTVASFSNAFRSGILILTNKSG